VLRTGSVNASSLNVRPTASTSRPPVARLDRGARLTVVGKRTTWYRIEAGAVRGWAASRYVALDPVLLVDLYRGDLGPSPPWPKVAAAPGYVGAILKATEGESYPQASWFVSNWPRVRAAGGARVGTSWFRGAYHFLIFARDGTRQADYFLDTVDAAGGWADGDLHPIVDVELGGDGHPNRQATKAQVIDVVSAWTARVKARTGRSVLLYGRNAMQELGIRKRMGASHLWNPSYTETMRSTAGIGWPANRVPLWQYTDGVTNKTAYPTAVPGFGAVDASVFLAGHIDDLSDRLCR